MCSQKAGNQEVKGNPSHYDLMNAVMICLGDDPENQDNNILKLLEVLLSNNAKASEKRRFLQKNSTYQCRKSLKER